MRQISMRDLKLADSLNHMSEIDMLHPENEVEVKKVLKEIGFDIKQNISFIPCLHRDMQQRVAVGFVITGEYSLERKYNKFLDMTDRVVITGMKDRSLAKDMLEIMGKKFTYTNPDESEYKIADNDQRYYSPEKLRELGYTGFEDDTEDTFIQEHGGLDSDCEMIVSQVEALVAIRVSLRGE